MKIADEQVAKLAVECTFSYGKVMYAKGSILGFNAAISLLASIPSEDGWCSARNFLMDEIEKAGVELSELNPIQRQV